MIPELKSKIEGDSIISPLVSDRVFCPKPLKEQTNTYITLQRTARNRLVAQDLQDFKFFVFSKTISEIETISEALINLFEDDQIPSKNTYKIVFLAQNDSTERLGNGFYWSILDFRFQMVV